MKKINQFITQFTVLGALSLGLINNSLATDIQKTQSVDIQTIRANITKHIAQVLEKQMALGRLTQDARIKINIEPSLQNNQSDNSSATLKSHLDNNQTSRKDGLCYIQFTFDEHGNIPYLANKNSAPELAQAIAFKNETQRKIAREFLVLHEYYHCEFGAIQNPIITPGKDTVFNHKINYVLKDQVSSHHLKYPSYIDTLNENYADTSAFMNLILTYGPKNPDLNYVLKSIQTQRHAFYFQSEPDTHFTHMSLENVMNQETIDRLVTMSNMNTIDKNSYFKQLALEISNFGTQKLIVNNEHIRNTMLSDKALSYSVMSHAENLLRYHSTSPEFRDIKTPPNPWAEGVRRGFSYEVGAKIIHDFNFSTQSFYDTQGKPRIDNKVIFDNLYKLADKNLSLSDISVIDNSYATADQFKQSIIENVKPNKFDQLTTPLNQQQSLNKMNTLRINFTNAQKIVKPQS